MIRYLDGSNYERVKTIQQTKGADIYVAKNLKTGSRVLVKSLNYGGSVQQIESVINEIKLSLQLCRYSQHIVQCFGVCRTEQSLNIV